MAENKLAFLKDAFPGHQVQFAEDFAYAVIRNPFYDENMKVYYYAEDDFTPFCVCFSFQHGHLTDEENVVEWIDEYITGKTFAIEFFQDGRRCFGGDITADEMKDLTYANIEKCFAYVGSTKLFRIADAFKVRGWDPKKNMDAMFVRQADGSVAIEKRDGAYGA